MLIEIIKPSDLHTHVRQIDGVNPLMRILVPLYQKTSYYTVCMPNTKPPIRTGWDAQKYKEQILECADKHVPFYPIVPIKILWGEDFKTTPQVITEAHMMGVRCAKMYMAGVTTNSDDGVKMEDIPKLYPTFAKMAEFGMVLQIHGEDPTPTIIAHQREFRFHKAFQQIDHALNHELKMVFEHVSDGRTIKMLEAMGDNVAGTLSTHFFYITLNDVVEPGLRPQHSCKPIAKNFEDRDEIVRAATSGNPKFFWGSDIAPHPREKKYEDKGACGCFPGQYNFLWVIKKFEEMNALHNLENFASIYGPQFYGLEIPKEKLQFEKCDPYLTEKMYHNIEIWNGGEDLNWVIK